MKCLCCGSDRFASSAGGGGGCAAPYTMLFFDTGAGFRPEEMLRQNAAYPAGDFELSFTLPSPAVVRGLRWDPVEYRTCRVRLEEVAWQDAAGATTRLDPERVTGNGVRSADGEWVFETLDPMVLLPVAGEVAAVRLRGRCVVESLGTSLDRVRQIQEQQRARLAQTAAALYATLYLDRGAGFCPEDAVYGPAEYDGGEFDVTFALPGAPAVKALRWDPLENRFCRLALAAASWRDRDGRETAIDLGRVGYNGERSGDGAVAFDTLDPAVTLPVAGEVAAVRLRGRCDVEPVADSLPRLRQALAAQRDRLDEQARHIDRLEEQCRAREQQLEELDAYCRLEEQQLQAAWAEAEDLGRQLMAARSEALALSRALQAARSEARWAPVRSVRSALAFLPRLLGRWARRAGAKD